MKLTNQELAIFDHSGVLSDDRKPVYETNMRLFEQYGLSRISYTDWLTATMASASDFLESQKVTVPKEEVNSNYARLFQEVCSEGLIPTMYADVPDTLEALKQRDLKLTVISSHPLTSLKREMDLYGIAQFFTVISGDPTPKNARLVSLCEQQEVDPHNAFFVEDTIYGLRSAAEARVNGIGVSTGYHSRERLLGEKPHAVIDSLSELVHHLD